MGGLLSVGSYGGVQYTGRNNQSRETVHVIVEW